jgi:hypothetical protein
VKDGVDQGEMGECLGEVVEVVSGAGAQVLGKNGAFDSTWRGIEQLPRLNDEVRRRWPESQARSPDHSESAYRICRTAKQRCPVGV